MKSKKNKEGYSSRRRFIKKGLAASSIFIVPRNVLGGIGYTAPSDQLNIAAIGSGGKGESDITNASVNGRERISALCDVDFSGSASKTIKKFPKAKLYADYREMLEKEKILTPSLSLHLIMFMVQQLFMQWKEANMFTFKNQ